ncbi:MAG: PEGA domain-containing protein [Coriobacteriia bacterium]|nr:PEGA domain-containing protein [Coriobacteriia bacterium]
MEEYRSRKRGSKKTFHGRYGTIDPARTVAGRSARHVADPQPRRAQRPQYLSKKASHQRGGRGPRRGFTGRSRLVLLGLALAAIAGIALLVFVFTRPASAIITTSPDDAMILFDGSVVGTGTLEVEDLDPGSYTIQVERAGFDPLNVTAELKRGRRTKLDYDLTPQPQLITVVTHPAGAQVTIAPEGEDMITATAPTNAEIPSGPMTLTLEMEGYNTFTREFFVDSPLDLEYHLDPEGQVLHGIGLITTAGAPKGVSVTHDGAEAWTSILNGPPSIQIFDPRTGELIGGVDIGEYGAVEVIFNKAGTLAYTSQMETAKCFEIDVKTRQVLREFDTQSAWTKWVELSPDETKLYASNWSGDDVSIIDLTTGALVKRIRVSDTPRGMYATDDGKSLYVAGFDSGDLERIDLATGTVTALFTEGGALRHIVADEKTGRLFISDMSQDLIWVHDIATGTTTKFVDVDEKPNTIDLTPDGKMLFVSCRGENNDTSYYIPGPEWGSILVFDAVSGQPLDALIAGNQPTALDVSDDGKVLIFSDFLDNRLRVYEIPEYEVFAKAGGGRYEEHFAEIKK